MAQEDVKKDATVEDDKKNTEKKVDKTSKKSKKGSPEFLKSKGFQLGATAVVAVLCGLGIGHFALPSARDVSLTGTTTVAENALDSTPLASYTYDGKTYTVTAKEVLDANGQSSSAKDSDGNYTLPTSDDVVSYIRTKIIVAEANKEGISASDDDIKDYAKTNLGSDDLDSLASSYGMDSDTFKDQLRQSVQIEKLRESKVDTSSADGQSAPEAPTAPADGQESTPTSDYAQYIINLAGDQWDKDANDGKGGWKDSNSTYAQAENGQDITNDSATYEAAQAAYYQAYSDYQSSQSDVSSQWMSYLDGILDNVTCSLGTLAV